MTDLYDEWWTQRSAVTEALSRGGQILITGLGLGLVAEAILRVDGSRVSRITIIEQSPDVIGLVAPFLQSRYPDRIEIINADAFTWTPAEGCRFTVGWHDIWPNPYAPENGTEMERLTLHHGKWCDWQGFWPKTYLEAAAA
jgi:predicted membrane-bound spermidine synthase